MIIVFVKNKLVSVDNIIPILLEANAKHGKRSLIVTLDQLAYEGIKSNVVLNDAVNKVGSILYLGNGIRNKILRRFIMLFQFIFLIYHFFKSSKIIHFGLLDVFPLRVLGVLFSKNIYLCEVDSYKHMKEKTINDILEHVFNRKSIYANPVGKSIIYFNKAFPIINNFNLRDKSLYKFKTTRGRRWWIDHSYDRADYYMDRYHPRVNLAKGYIVYILSFLGNEALLYNKEASLNLFKKTIFLLSKNYPELQILIKPHPVTDIELVSDIISDQEVNATITYLHASVLSRYAILFISNIYSTVLADAKSLLVPTVEYTHYNNKVLNETNGRSFGYLNVDYFINNDEIDLTGVISTIMLNSSTNDRHNKFINYTNETYKFNNSDEFGLVDDLCN